MDEEDWDAPATTTTTSTTTTATAAAKATPQQSSTAATTDNTQQTLKITDGYKYSYEALTSPANVDDWIDPPTYASSKRMPNGFSQNLFRDNNKPFRGERNDNYKRFDNKRNNNYSNPSRDFATPKPNRFSNRPLPNVNPTDWDAPVNAPATPMNGSFNVNVPITNTAEDAWDAMGAGTPHSMINQKSTPIATFSQAKPINVDEEDWDNPGGGLSSQASVAPAPEIPTYRPSSVASVSMHSTHSEPAPRSMPAPIDEENWDEPGTPLSSSQIIMPTFRPSSANASFAPSNEEDWDAGPSTASAEDLYSGGPRYDSSWQSNKYPRSRNFDDHFGRDPYARSSRGSFRNSYDRGGRGSRGSRGGRDFNRGGRGRDFNPSFHSRDNSRNRGDRDKSYPQSPFSKSNDRPYQPPVPTSFNNTVVETEENWDDPSDFGKGPAEKIAPPPKAAPPPVIPPPPVPVEESWD